MRGSFRVMLPVSMTQVTDFFARAPVFTRDEFAASRAGGSRNPRTIEELLAYHVARGRIVRIRRGLYGSVPVGHGPTTFSPDHYLIAGKLAPDAVVAFHTALELHGLAHTAFRRITLLTRAAVRRFQFREVEFVAIRPPASLVRHGAVDYAIESIERGGATIRCTSIERTLVDALDRPALCGGMDEVWQSLQSLRGIYARRVTGYLEVLGNKTTAARVGFFLDLHRETLGIDDEALRQVRALAPRQPVYLERTRGGLQRLVAAWNLIVPAELLAARGEVES